MGVSKECAAWLTAARDPAIAGDLEAVYAIVADQINARGPACWASGRCCNFEAAGHSLFVTGLEAAYALVRLDHGPPPNLTDAVSRPSCPFQVRNLCGIHAIKPLGCRVYFCDRTAQDWQQDLSERALSMIRAIHDRRAIPYRYDEWRRLLSEFAEHF